MAAMTETTGSFILPHDGRPFTVHDLEAAPDDGNRYELIDRTLLVSPAPSVRHQTVAFELGVVLRAACPKGMRVLLAPLAVRPDEITGLQPDVLVARDEDLTEQNLPMAPSLAVEVLSPSSVFRDMTITKAAYQRMGVPDYWVIDPRTCRLAVFELDATGLTYQRVADVEGNKAFEATRPFPVRVVPDDLLAGLPDLPD